MIRVMLPAHLQSLAGTGKEIEISVDGEVTQRSIVDAIEARYPMLKGTIRDHHTKKRRPMVRFFVEEEDISHDPMDEHLPETVANGREPFWIIGAISGG
jgi:molybdopterin synthase sulfur carrier subunit